MTIILPYDILQTIYDHVDAKEDLARSCLVSKELLAIAQPPLYSSLEFTVLQFGERFPRFHRFGGTTVQMGLVTMSYQSRICDQTKLLLSTLRRGSLICSSVRRVCLMGIYIKGQPGEHTTRRASTGSTVLKELFSLLPSVKIFVLSKLHDAREVDQVVARHQRHREGGVVMPKFRLVLADPMDELRVETVEAHYEGFRLLSDTKINTGIRLGRFLQSSKDSLTRLSIPFNMITELSSFTHLTYISLFARIISPPPLFLRSTTSSPNSLLFVSSNS